jgi:TPR repeat protein
LACKFCAWICHWLCAGANPIDAYWDRADDWERGQSNESELFCAASREHRDRIDAALAMREADLEAAFRIFVDVADAGMPWAMETVAGHYERGIVVAADFQQAQLYYRRAIEAGSWMATIGYARLLVRHGHFDASEQVLRDGVDADFLPAHFWMAWYRLKRSRRRATCREIRPLLERAADAGHPLAGLVLARLKLLGKFGVREIWPGFRQIKKLTDRSGTVSSASDAQGVAMAPDQVQAVG